MIAKGDGQSMSDPQIGRELKADELLVRTMVALSRDDRPYTVLAWVREVGTKFAEFYYGASSLTCVRRSDGTLIDETGQQIHVYEFLGKYEGRPTTQ